MLHITWDKPSHAVRALAAVPDLAWQSFRRAFVNAWWPSWKRPLGSCYFPPPADIVDIGFHYGEQTRRVLRDMRHRLVSQCFPPAATDAPEYLWQWEEGVVAQKAARLGKPAPGWTGFADQAYNLICDLAELVRSGQAPLPAQAGIVLCGAETASDRQERKLAEHQAVVRWLPPALRQEIEAASELGEDFSPMVLDGVEETLEKCLLNDYVTPWVGVDGDRTVDVRSDGDLLLGPQEKDPDGCWERSPFVGLKGGTYVVHCEKRYNVNDLYGRRVQLWTCPTADPLKVGEAVRHALGK